MWRTAPAERNANDPRKSASKRLTDTKTSSTVDRGRGDWLTGSKENTLLTGPLQSAAMGKGKSVLQPREKPPVKRKRREHRDSSPDLATGPRFGKLRVSQNPQGGKKTPGACKKGPCGAGCASLRGMERSTGKASLTVQMRQAVLQDHGSTKEGGGGVRGIKEKSNCDIWGEGRRP